MKTQRFLVLALSTLTLPRLAVAQPAAEEPATLDGAEQPQGSSAPVDAAGSVGLTDPGSTSEESAPDGMPSADGASTASTGPGSAEPPSPPIAVATSPELDDQRAASTNDSPKPVDYTSEYSAKSPADTANAGAPTAESSSLNTGLGMFTPGKGVNLVSNDERFAFTAHLWASVLYTVQNARAEHEWDQSIQIRRARMKFSGWAFSQHNKFGIELALSPRDMAFDATNSPHASPFIDWFMQFDYLRDLTLTVGQRKVQYNREHVMSASALHHVDLSLANNEFNFNRDLGVDISSKDLFGWDLLRYTLGVYLGEGRDPFGGDVLPPGSTDFGMLYASRVDILPFGMFDDYKQGDLERHEKFRWSLGLGYNYQDKAHFVRGNQGPFFNDGGTANYHNFVVDTVAKFRGLSIAGAFFYRNGTRHFGDATVTDDAGDQVAPDTMFGRNGYGITGSLGYLLPSTNLELVARYSTVRPLGKTGEDTDVNVQDEYIGGLNYYFYGHALKLQAEYGYVKNDQLFEKGADRIRFQIVQAF